jgi:hypothetical protein
MRIPAIAAVLVLAFTTLSASAHHERVVFDTERMVTLKGTITKLDWANPHVQVYFDQKDASGKAQSWRIEMEKPAALREQGLDRDVFKPGLDLTVIGVPPIPGTHVLWPFELKLADGHHWGASVTYK